MPYYPTFTGRNVPLEEISEATGLTIHELKAAIFADKFGFAVVIGSPNSCSIYCSDKKVWEEIGYFNSEITEDLFPEKVKERVFTNVNNVSSELQKR
ncbi:MAG: hypothetical protein K2J80_12535 [Oscillospiraceae bacterium]|nr:hypothetical protein [Oscillospiraceae bacterium]